MKSSTKDIALIPAKLTGRQPIAISRSSIREIYDGRSGEVHIIMADGQEVAFNTYQATAKDTDELYGILFGPNVLSFKALAKALPGSRKINPAAVCSVELLDPEPAKEEWDRSRDRPRSHSLLILRVLNGPEVEVPYADFELFQRIVVALYGPEALTKLEPRTIPTMTQEAMAIVGGYLLRKFHRAEQSEEDAARRRTAELERAKTKRFGPVFR